MKRIITLAAFTALAFALPASSEAQLSNLLKKAGQIKKKVEKKVDKTVRNISNAIEGAKPAADENKTGTTDNTVPSAVNDKAQQPSSVTPMYSTAQLREMAEKSVSMPHLTRETLFGIKDIRNFKSISTPSDGIFSVLEYNRDIGYSSYYSFYTVSGEYLFAPEWETPGEAPRFDSGAAIAKAGKKNSAGNKPLYILYGDGTVRELPVSITEATQFYDGVAKVSYSEGKNMGVYYINTRGEKIWPALAMNYSFESKMDMSIKNGARHLCDGRRAYYDNIKRRWGYLDDKGNIALAPIYAEARDFSNGYALVIAKGDGKDYPMFINTAGKEIVRPPVDAPTLFYAQEISDIDNGLFLNYADFTYYDLQGQPVRSYRSATELFDGFAFIKENDNKFFTAVNDKFIPQRRMALDQTKRSVIQAFEYSKSGVVTVDDEEVFSASGRHLLTAGSQYPRNGHIGRFSADGYAPFEATMNWNGNNEYFGITDIAGNILVAFCSNPDGGRGDIGILPPPEIPPISPGPPPVDDPEPQPIPQPIPPEEGLKPVNGTPKGPKQVNDVTYQVTVKASPAEAADVTGSGRYHYADKVKVGGTVNEGWILTGVENADPFTLAGRGSEYVVRGNGELTLLFVKKEDEPTMGNGAFEGKLADMTLNDQMVAIPEMKLYLEMNPDNNYPSPYGANTAGVFSVINNPEETLGGQLRANGKPKEGSLVTFNFFPVPMKVQGVTHTEDGRQWLVFDGGCNIMANTTVVSTGAKSNDTSAIEALMFNLMLMFDNFDTAQISPAHYRAEMLDIDPGTGEFTFGELQRFSPRGWVPGGDPGIVTYENGFFVTKADPGLPADYVKGVRMKPVAGGRQLLWTPPASIYRDPSYAESVAKGLGEQYRNFANQYEIMQKVNIRSISETLDRLFKSR